MGAGVCRLPGGSCSWTPGRAPLRPCLVPTEEGTYDEYENDPGITAIALYDYQAGERPPRGPGGAGQALHHIPCHSPLKSPTFGA